ncbi:hypothetical protein ABT186_02280 [Streptomyces sp. NPDC001634]|uniref:hypothetical protein n=1 Tax=Streptomyces sp. NPDC001634 TaxID=3154390 RepID=UPI003325C3DA
MESIRDHAGEVRICASCGQPCGLGETESGEMWQHFSEQWDGVHCPRFPLASVPLIMEWDEMALKQVKAEYPDTRR